MKKKVVVCGLGEIGQPISEILATGYKVYRKDTFKQIYDAVPLNAKFEALHICIPGTIPDFKKIVKKYICIYKPEITIIHSTVIPGTTDEIAKKSRTLVAFSPVRGKHEKMKEDLLGYIKFIGGNTDLTTELAYRHLNKVFPRLEKVANTTTCELMKLYETTYLSLLVTQAQEFQRYCSIVGANYSDLLKVTKEVSYYPRYEFIPGYLGGHCCISNVEILQQIKSSFLTDFILKSNEKWALDNNIDKEKEKSIKTRMVLKPKEI